MAPKVGSAMEQNWVLYKDLLSKSVFGHKWQNRFSNIRMFHSTYGIDVSGVFNHPLQISEMGSSRSRFLMPGGVSHLDLTRWGPKATFFYAQ